MSDLNDMEMSQFIKVSGELVRDPGSPEELEEIASALEEEADERERLPQDKKTWADLSYPEQLRQAAKEARRAAYSLSKPPSRRSLANRLYPQLPGEE